ncbi:MAG: hypothetical protein J6A01_02270, partial [Proteobacteria bacterium]|nr:hypothetical protein [Pseudomonadota bacterium]
MLIKTKSLLVFTLVTSLVTGCGNDGQDGTNPDDVPQSQDSDATGTDDGTETSKPDSGDQGDQGSDDSSDTDDGNGEQDETDGQETPENQEEQQEDPQQEDPQEEPESISCEHDICVVDYPDIAEGKAESLGNTYYSCVEGVLGEVKTCPENQICMDGGCVDAFTEGDEKSCLISPDDALSLMHENDYGRCSANGNYSIVCRYGKLTVRSCERPCENAEYGYVRCPQTQEDEALVYYDRYTNSRFSLHYAQLSDEEKTIYRALFSAVLNHEEEYSIQSISKDSCQKVLDAFKADASDLAGQKLSLSAKSSEEDPATLENCQYKLKYTEKTEDQINQDKALQKAAFEILETMDVYSSDVEKEMAVHNWMLTNIKKDSNSKTVYGAIVEHAANNKGLSDAFRYLMVRLMIPTFGVAGGSKSTPWNIIQIDGNYYNIDVALDRLSKCDALGYEGESCPKYTYFNRSDEFFNQHDG